MTIWNDIEPLEKLSLVDIREALELQQLEAFMRGEATLRVPAIVVRKIHQHLSHAIANASGDVVDLWENPPHEGKGRPQKSWRTARFHELARVQFRRRKAELKAAGLSTEDAERQAADEVAYDNKIGPSTLIQLAKYKIK